MSDQREPKMIELMEYFKNRVGAAFQPNTVTNLNDNDLTPNEMSRLSSIITSYKSLYTDNQEILTFLPSFESERKHRVFFIGFPASFWYGINNPLEVNKSKIDNLLADLYTKIGINGEDIESAKVFLKSETHGIDPSVHNFDIVVCRCWGIVLL